MARATLAARRSARFARIWGFSFGALTVLALLVPLLGDDPGAADRATNGRLAADTLRSAQRVRDALGAVTKAESLLVDAGERMKAAGASGAARAASAGAPRTTTASAAVADLAQRIERARRERTVAALLAVTEHPAVSSGPRMRALADSLRKQDERGGASVTIGNTILAIAQYRRTELEANGIGSTIPPAPLPRAAAIATAPAFDTTALRAAMVAAQDSLASRRRAHDSLTTALNASGVPPVTRDGGVSLLDASPAIAMAMLLVFGLLVRFATALSREVKAPTLADAGEAERLTRAPVLATVRNAMLEGPARFHPSGIDPFRILYLGLTATGTRVRTTVVTGFDPVIAAATGARLAIAAAADHRQTLVVDLDAANIPLSRTFRERPEPGTSDVLARAFTWREVARPVGSSDGLPITLLPAGTERQDAVSGDAWQELMESFVRLRGGYELTIVVAPPDGLALAATLVESGPVILTAVVGDSSLVELESEVARIRAAGHRLQGLVLWDAPRPELPSRAELAALLSRRKGRTPGGSFEAVQRAIHPQNSSNRKT